jgi:CheY-like chemotaxis protein
VVDNHRDAAESLAALLRIWGNDVATAADGQEAISLCTTFRPHLVLLDLGMPGIDGFEVCRRLRADAWGGRPVIAAVTGWGREEARRRSLAAGFDEHLLKPVETERLEELLAASRSVSD